MIDNLNNDMDNNSIVMKLMCCIIAYCKMQDMDKHDAE